MSKKEEKEHIGIILSEARTREAACQLVESAERGGIKQGMLLLVETGGKKLLARIAEIIPYNAFYTIGDAWSEPRRKGLPIPEDVARKYEVCKLELLIEIPRAEIKYPPQPGDPAFKIDPTKHQKDIFGVSEGDPKYVWYGSLAGYGKAPIPLYVENIPMHLAIFGVTGSGKSFDAGALIEKLVAIPVEKGGSNLSYPMIIIDAHGDYTDYVDYVVNGNTLGHISWIKRYIFPKAYMRIDQRQTGKPVYPIGINLDVLYKYNPRELAEIIILFYKGTTEGAELAISGIDALFERMVTKGYTSIQDAFLLNFAELKVQLNVLAAETNMHDATRKAIERALDSFRTIEDRHNLLSTKSELQEEKFVDDITKDGGIAVIDFSADAAPGVGLETKQLVMTYLASLLFEKFTDFKTKGDQRYLMFIIEEAQNFCPDRTYPISSSLAHYKLSSIATQGRKFGLSLCLISQRPSFVDRIVLSMCNTFFIHRVSPEDVGFVRSVTGGLPSSQANRLTTLDMGEIIVTGQMNKVPFPLDITVLKSDRQVPHTIGETRVVEDMAKLRGIKLGE